MDGPKSSISPKEIALEESGIQKTEKILNSYSAILGNLEQLSDGAMKGDREAAEKLVDAANFASQLVLVF